MTRISTVVSLLVALVITALTFGAIGQSVGAQPDIHGTPTAAHAVFEGIAGTRVALGAALTRLIQKV